MYLTPPQSEVISDTHRFRVVNIGRRGGKTTLAIEEMKALAYAREARIAYIAPTYQQARDIAWEALKKELLPVAANVNESRLEIRVKNRLETESILVLRGWESIESLRGQFFDFLVIDEVASMRNFWAMWQEVIRPTLADRKGGALFISTPKGFNYFYDLFNMQAKDSDYRSFHYTTYDNNHIPREEVDKARLELTEDRFAQEYLADFRKTEGLVYKEFDRTRHLFSSVPGTPNYREVPNAAATSVAIDWGFTNPAAILKVVEDGDARFWVTKEYYESRRTTPELIETIRSFGGTYHYPDPAEPDRLEEMRRAGLPVREVSKDVAAGIATVAELFKTNRIFIDESCTNLIWELETYVYAEKKAERNENEVPVKENDHALDALRYVLHMRAQKRPSVAHVHYQQSSMPQSNLPGANLRQPDAPKLAHQYVPKL